MPWDTECKRNTKDLEYVQGPKTDPFTSLQLTSFLGWSPALTYTTRENTENRTIRKTDLKFTSEGEANLCPQGGIKLASSE